MHDQSHTSSSNKMARIVVGALVVFFLYQGVIGQNKKEVPLQPAQLISVAKAVLVIPNESEDHGLRLAELAKSDHIALLKWAMEHYQQDIQDFQAVLRKQERVNGVLKTEEEIAVRFKNAPFSVIMEWQKNAKTIDKLLYVEGYNDNKMIVHPTGWLSWIKSVKRDPRCAEAQRSSRKTCDQFGFYRTLEDMIRIYQQAKQEGDLQTRYLGQTQVDNRPCIAMERVLPAKKDYPCARMVMEFDEEYLLPTAITSYDWQGKLLSKYVFTDIKLNTGLSLAEFTPQANQL